MIMAEGQGEMAPMIAMTAATAAMHPTTIFVRCHGRRAFFVRVDSFSGALAVMQKPLSAHQCGSIPPVRARFRAELTRISPLMWEPGCGMQGDECVSGFESGDDAPQPVVEGVVHVTAEPGGARQFHVQETGGPGGEEPSGVEGLLVADQSRGGAEDQSG
jgi:hypothetical protein